MTNQTDNFPDLMSDDPFEVVMRGYSRRQVRDYMDRTRNQIRDLEERLARAIEQAEQSRVELAEARRKMAESPKNPDELGERLSQILKLAQEEAAANKEASEMDAARVRENAAADAERLLASAREQAETIRATAQEEAERRLAEATAASEQLVAQAGADAEKTLGSARSEAEETLRTAQREAERHFKAAQQEAERLLSDARFQSEAMVTTAQRRSASLDEHTGQRVAYLKDTHSELVRRLNEIESVVGDLLRKERAAGPLIDEAAVVPPAPYIEPPALPEPAPKPLPEGQAVPGEADARESGARESEFVVNVDDDVPHDLGHDALPRESAGPRGGSEDLRVIVDDVRHRPAGTGSDEIAAEINAGSGWAQRPAGSEPLRQA